MAEATVLTETEPSWTWRLPSLDGRRGRAVMAIYALVATLIFILIAGSFWFNARDYFGNMPTAAEYGFRTRTNDGVPVIAAVSRPSDQGLREGDRIIAINGADLPSSATEFTIAERLAADPDGRVTLVARSADGAIRTHELEREAVTSATIEAKSRMPLWLFIGIGFVSNQLPLLVWFGASLFLAWRRPRDPEAMLLAFGFALLCITRGSGFWLSALEGVPESAIIIMENLGGSVTLLAIAAFPDGRFANRLARLSILLIAIVSILTVAVPLAGIPSQLLDASALLTVIVLLASVWRRYRRTTDQTQRQQIKWAVFGFCAAMLLFLPVLTATVAGLVPDDGPAPILLYGVVVQFGWLLIPTGLLISLLKFRLYDADAAISRSAAYAAVTLLLAAIFAASAEGLEWMFEVNFGRDAGALPSAIAAALAVLAFTPLNHRLQLWAEQRFRRDLVQLRRDLPECVDDLRETSSLDKLLETILAKVSAGVRAERAAIVIGRDVAATRAVDRGEVANWLDRARPDDSVESLDCDREDVMLPMRVPLRVRHAEEGNFGWLLLGPRPDESFYGRDEREALAELAGPIARAVQIVLVREAREAEADRRRRDIEDRLTAIEKALADTVKTRGQSSSRPATG